MAIFIPFTRRLHTKQVYMSILATNVVTQNKWLTCLVIIQSTPAMINSGATHGIRSDYEPKNDRLADCRSDITWLWLRFVVKLTAWPKASTWLRFLVGVLMSYEIYLPSSESRSPEGKYHLWTVAIYLSKNMVLHPNTITGVTNLHIEFVISCMAFSYILLWWKLRLHMLSLKVICEKRGQNGRYV